MRYLQLLMFELSAKCNLSTDHPLCPINDKRRWGQLDTRYRLDDETILRLAAKAYHDLGFLGLLGFHFYNEPLLSKDRMLELMRRIRARVPKSRFILYSNGTMIEPPASELSLFEQVIITNYEGRDFSFLKRVAPRLVVIDPALDNRRNPPETFNRQPCLRPFVEMIVDCLGNVHLCSMDWQGKGSPGNVFTSDFAKIVSRFEEIRDDLCGKEMSDAAPVNCLYCTNKYDHIARYDCRIANRSNRAVARSCA